MNETNKQGYERSEQTRIRAKRAKRVFEFHLLLKYVNIFLQIYQFLERSKQTRVGAKRTNEDTSKTSSPECKGCIGDCGGAWGCVGCITTAFTAIEGPGQLHNHHTEEPDLQTTTIRHLTHFDAFPEKWLGSPSNSFQEKFFDWILSINFCILVWGPAGKF